MTSVWIIFIVIAIIAVALYVGYNIGEDRMMRVAATEHAKLLRFICKEHNISESAMETTMHKRTLEAIREKFAEAMK